MEAEGRNRLPSEKGIDLFQYFQHYVVHFVHDISATQAGEGQSNLSTPAQDMQKDSSPLNELSLDSVSVAVPVTWKIEHCL